MKFRATERWFVNVPSIFSRPRVLVNNDFVNIFRNVDRERINCSPEQNFYYPQFEMLKEKLCRNR